MKRHCGFLLSDVLPFGLPPLSVLDVGALLEGTPVYEPLLENSSTQLYGFEPNDSAREDLKQAFDGRGEWFPHVLGDGTRRTFHETVYPGCSSLFSPNPTVVNAFSGMGTEENMNFHVSRMAEVSTTRLDEIEEVPGIDFVKLDIQGAELMVLQNGMSKLERALVIQTEAAFLPLYQNQPLFADQHIFLREYGFELHKFIDITGRPLRELTTQDPIAPVSQLIEADAIFVRGLMQPEMLSVDELLKTAQILHDVYCSYDVVCHMLQAYDAKALVPVLDLYLEALKKNAADLSLLFLNIKSADKHRLTPSS